MSTDQFVVGSNGPSLKWFVCSYTISGQPLELVETVQVVARLPYCLYVPTTPYVFDSPDNGQPIGVLPEKVWTKRAEGSTIAKYEAIAPNKSVFLRDAQLITDVIGQPEPLTGDLQAHNMEFDRDPSGYFRYTRLTLEFDWQVPLGFDPYNVESDSRDQERTHSIIDQLTSIALLLANYFVDVYRTVTEDVYLERISMLMVEDIRIGVHKSRSIRKPRECIGRTTPHKLGYHPNMLGPHGIRAAQVSKPKEVVDKFRSFLESGFRPSTDELLRQNALAALERHDVKLAVIESFISLEVYVESFYSHRLSDTMTTAEIEEMLATGNNWKLAVRLKELLRQRFGKAIADLNGGLWATWLKRYRQRNGIVHRNLIPTEDDAKEILELNESIKRLMGTL